MFFFTPAVFFCINGLLGINTGADYINSARVYTNSAHVYKKGSYSTPSAPGTDSYNSRFLPPHCPIIEPLISPRLLHKKRPRYNPQPFLECLIDSFLCQPTISILILIEEKVFFSGIIGPDVFNAFIDFTFVLNLLQVFDYFKGCAGADGIVNEFVLGCWPWGIFQLRCKFKTPIHSFLIN